VEPETRWAAAFNPPHMMRPESTAEAAVLPGMIEVIVGIVASGIMPNPFFAVVDVRSVGVSGLIAVIATVVLFGCSRLAPIGRGTAGGRARSNRFVFLMILCKDRHSE
jgi:hypothetical protein